MGCCSSLPKREMKNGRFCDKNSEELVHLLPGEELSMPFFEWIISTSPELEKYSKFNDMWNDFQRHAIRTIKGRYDKSEDGNRKSESQIVSEIVQYLKPKKSEDEVPTTSSTTTTQQSSTENKSPEPSNTQDLSPCEFEEYLTPEKLEDATPYSIFPIPAPQNEEMIPGLSREIGQSPALFKVWTTMRTCHCLDILCSCGEDLKEEKMVNPLSKALFRKMEEIRKEEDHEIKILRIMCLIAYTLEVPDGIPFYVVFNTFFRRITEPEHVKQFPFKWYGKLLFQAFQWIPLPDNLKTNRKTKLYRGLTCKLDYLEVGEIFAWRQFTSATQNESIARRYFQDADEKTLIVIKNILGTMRGNLFTHHMISVAEWSPYPEEELLIHPLMTFEVVKVEMERIWGVKKVTVQPIMIESHFLKWMMPSMIFDPRDFGIKI